MFSLSEKAVQAMFSGPVEIPQHLAYVEWYLAFEEPSAHHKLYKIKPLKDAHSGGIWSIVPVANICHSIHLLPKFGPMAPLEWTTSNVLDLCTVFFLNVFTDQHLYRLIV